MADSDTKPLPLTPQATLYLLAHLRWPQPGAGPLESRRAAALDALANLLYGLHQGTTGTPPHTLLGGQVALLDEVNDLRPDLVALAVIFNAGGKLSLGPWYVQVDEALTGGEALVRNLLLGRVAAQRYGIKLATIAFMPEPRFHCRQLPQILRGFGTGALLLHRESSHVSAPFQWMSPDGSSLLALTHDASLRVGGHDDLTPAVIQASLDLQRALFPDGPYLLLHERTGGLPRMNDLETALGLPVSAEEPNAYLRSLRYQTGEGQYAYYGGDLEPDAASRVPRSLSARLPLKQTSARLQYRLLRHVEPLLAFALVAGQLEQPDNARALLNQAWRALALNQRVTGIGGHDSDDAHAVDALRGQQIDALADHLIATALAALPGTPGAPDAIESSARPPEGVRNSAYLVVWNGHNWPVSQVVEVTLTLPSGRYPARLRLPDTDEERLFAWQPLSDDPLAPTRGRIAFLATVPGLGYTSYSLDLSDSPPGPHTRVRTAPGTTIGSVNGETFGVDGEGLTWGGIQGVTLTDLLRFVDGGDAGDTLRYVPPAEDLQVMATLADQVTVDSSPVYERLVLRHRLRIAPGLSAGGRRERGLRRLDLTTTATFYHGQPGLYFHTRFDNTAHDHRLRVHLRTGIDSPTLLTHGVYGLDKRLRGRLAAMDTLCAVSDRARALALLARGLPEVEALAQDGQSTLALTLLRAVGQQGGPAGGSVPGAQCLGPLEAAFALRPFAPGDHPALLRAAAEYAAPLHAYQYATRPERPTRSFLSVISDMADGSTSDGEGAIVTAFKPPQKGGGWIVRLFNPHERPVEVLLTPYAHAEFAQLVTLAEEPLTHLDMDANGRIAVQVKPQQLTSVRLRFT